MRQIELLAPARDADCGIEAIRHGADAVYIGGPAFGARAAAANTVDDIRRLCDEAHLFGARVYVTVNTILWDSELTAARTAIEQLYAVGVDALITQDLALLAMDLPPIALHASTQMDNRTPEKALWLEQMGFSQIVLARECSLQDIAAIHQRVKTPLEAFAHGALCVSYSGQCYASQHCFQRSANRGCCSQFCRLPFDLVDATGRPLVRDKHLLSLRDMNRMAYLEAMMDAGISSFKIEGRLKDVAYVKNVTAAYRQAIDVVLQRRSDTYHRSSYGTSTYTFVPDVSRSFNRGFTDYFLHGQRNAQLQNIHTPKAMGAYVGQVAAPDRRREGIGVLPADGVSFSAGDGLCYLEQGRLCGFRVNRVDGHRLIPAAPLRLPQGTALYRNQDVAFERLLSKPSATRTLAVDIDLRESAEGYVLTLHDEMGLTASCEVACPHETARTSQAEALQRNLGRLGNTPLTLRRLTCSDFQGERFLPASVLAGLRREAVEALLVAHRQAYVRESRRRPSGPVTPYFPVRLSYAANVSNALARSVLTQQGVEQIAPAYELEPPREALLMTCRYCLRYALGACLRHPQQADSLPSGPLFLRTGDGRRFRLVFDCQHCQMKIYATT
jgi:putative protease